MSLIVTQGYRAQAYSSLSTTIYHADTIEEALQTNLSADVTSLNVVQCGGCPDLVIAADDRTGDTDLSSVIPCVEIFVTLVDDHLQSHGETHHLQQYEYLVRTWTDFDTTSTDAYNDSRAIVGNVLDSLNSHKMLNSTGILATDELDSEIDVRVKYALVRSGPIGPFVVSELGIAMWTISGVVELYADEIRIAEY